MPSKCELIFQQWKASLSTRDKSKDAVPRDFEELFTDLKAEGMTAEAAYELLPKAIKAHYPSPSYVKNAYRKNKHFGKWASEKELEDQWKLDIENHAEQAYFEVYPIQTEKKKEAEAPKVYGNMSEKQYKEMREFADSIPEINWDALNKELEQSDTALSEMDDLEELLRKTTDESK